MTDTKPTTAEITAYMTALALDIEQGGGRGRISEMVGRAALLLQRVDALEAENDELRCLLGVVVAKYREIFSELESHKLMNRDSAKLEFDQTIFGIATPIIEKQKAEVAQLRQALKLAIGVAETGLHGATEWDYGDEVIAECRAELEQAKALAQQVEAK